jgi:hypothetical protein
MASELPLNPVSAAAKLQKPRVIVVRVPLEREGWHAAGQGTEVDEVEQYVDTAAFDRQSLSYEVLVKSPSIVTDLDLLDTNVRRQRQLDGEMFT